MTIKLPPLGPHDHPDPRSFMWSESEIRAIQDYARETYRLNMSPLSDEPNWRHPKIQGLIGSEARLRIQVDLIWRILEDPNQEFGPSDMEYWDTLHDKLKST